VRDDRLRPCLLQSHNHRTCRGHAPTRAFKHVPRSTNRQAGNDFLNNGEANWDDYTEMINECLLIIASAFQLRISY